MIRYIIVDSHRNMSEKRRKALTLFFTVSKQLPEDKALEQVNFCDWYESEYAVKWFEVLAVSDGVIAGYLRCFRNPDIISEWYIGDVYVLKDFRKKHIAAHMYERTFKELERYEAAEKVIATINRNNTASIGLHTLNGFSDTGEKIQFASFYADPEETVYSKPLYRTLPFPDNMTDEQIKIFIFPLWFKFCKEKGIKGKEEAEKRLFDALDQRKSADSDFLTIWNGNNLKGFRYKGVSHIW